MNDSSHSISITEEDAGKRLDNLLFMKIKHVPKSLLYKLIRKGRVKINGEKTPPSFRVELGDVLQMPADFVLNRSTKDIPAILIKLFNQSILLENDNLLVVDKPAGLGSHSGSGLNFGLIEVARRARQDVAKLDLVHRLDRDTSGCIVLSKNLHTLRELHKLWGKGDIEKIYLGLFKGRVAKTLNRIEINLEIQKNDDNRKRVFTGSGKRASTYFLKKDYYNGNTLATIKLETGRMHQIRAHAKYVGHPLAGDNKYGETEFNMEMKQAGLSRLFLHAFRLKIRSERINLDIKAPLPKDLSNILHIKTSVGQLEKETNNQEE